jgi:hypothetical protein
MSGPSKDKVSGQFGILHNEKLCDFFNLSNDVGTVKSMIM